MTSAGVFSALLLAYLTGIYASNDVDIVVLSVSQLREVVRNELNMTMAELLPEPPTCPPPNINATCLITREDKTAIVDSVKAAVSRTIEDLLLTKLSQLITPGYTSSHPASSCKEILQLAPQSSSGLYWIRGTDNGPKHMYCDMESCKGVAGGWMRVASINMTDTSNTCPSGLTTLTSPRRRCAMNTDGPACSSAVLPVQGIQYSQVCGKVIGYQDKTPDAFHRFITGQNTTDSNYVDGISITHGQSPRNHIWTLVAARHEHNSGPHNVCPCTNTRNTPPSPSVPGFVGDDYFCDTGSANRIQHIFYGDDPLWDGAGCGQYSTCCSFNSPPWFRKQLSTPTSDDIEMRLCADEDRVNEDINFETLELYVQ